MELEHQGPEPTRSRRRPPGAVFDGLVAAGVAQARTGGPDAVVLREATRSVGVSPNAAYRHFADRNDLLSAVAWEAMIMLSERMEVNIAEVSARRGTMKWARARLRAVGEAYLAFARDEPGLFRTAFSAPVGPHAERTAALGQQTRRTPLQILDETLDELVQTGALSRGRRDQATALAWATVHGAATLRLSGALSEQGDPAVLDRAIDVFIQRGLAGSAGEIR